MTSPVKICKDCDAALPLTSFYSRKGGDGYRSYCKPCWKSNTNKNRDTRKVEGRFKPYKKSPERARFFLTRYSNNNIKKGLCRQCTSKSLPSSKDLCEKHWIVKRAVARLGYGDVATAKRLKKKLTDQNYTCPYTGDILILGLNCHLDHIKPTSRFLEESNSIRTVEWISKRANLAKQNLTKDEFLDLCRHITDYASVQQASR